MTTPKSKSPQFDQKVLKNLWRVSPAAMARTLTRKEPRPWIAAPHLQLLSEWITDAVSGRKPRIIINMPPRHGKSELISKWTPLWFLENWPDKMVINTGYGTSFAEEWGGKVRALAVAHADKLSFKLNPDSRAAGRWHTTQTGGMYATGILGGITGRGADLFIMDDPIKSAKEANSLTYRNDLWTWYTDTARSRIMPGAAQILLMTRWHDDDLAGRLIREAEKGTGEQWHVLNLPAFALDDGKSDPLDRLPGEPLWADLARYLGMGGVSTMDYLRGLMQGMSQEAWEAQYQGQPGNLAKNGNVYKAYSYARNVRPLAFDPRRPLIWSLDFNVDPMCSTICQWHEEITPTTHLDNKKRQTVSVLQELSLPNSSTREACEEFINRTRDYRAVVNGRPLTVKIYGDRSGQSRKTTGETDYVEIREIFRQHPEYRVTLHLSKANPAVKDRVNAVNTMLCSAANEVKMLIDPSCKELLADFKQVQWKRDSSGNTTGQIDKGDQSRTHVSDACGYFIEKEFGLKYSRSGEQSGFMQ